MIEKTVLRCSRVAGEDLPAPPCDQVLATHEKACATNARLAERSAKAQQKYGKRAGWDVDVSAYETVDDEEEEALSDNTETGEDWAYEVEWDEENVTWKQVLKRVKPQKKISSTAQTADALEPNTTLQAKKLKTPENWARLKENHRLMKVMKKMSKWERDYQLRLKGQQPGDEALRRTYQKVYGEKTETALEAVRKLPLKAAFAALKGRFGINAYIKVRLGQSTDKHARWAALSFEEVQAQPEIQLANWKYFTRNWTAERKQKWADVKSVDEYKKKSSPDAKK